MSKTINTLGQLKKSGYKPRSVKEEIRQNLISAIQENRNIFQGIHGFDHTVIPDIERAILSGHNILFLGLRGQAKTRIARLLVQLLDEEIPIVEGSEINDDPLAPLSAYAKSKVEELGDDTPIAWINRDQRYVEKLATPDVSVADLIGDIDPIKAANLKLPYSDERVLHFGLVPRAHRGIFVINELPDLQPRIQVSLFNILQEGDLQIRGFNIRLPLDIQFIFTANPEDYTNRGSIITPLKDRIESQILTHYPEDPSTSIIITEQEAKKFEDQSDIIVPDLLKAIIQAVVEEARISDYTDVNSGVSARMGITAYENLISSAHRRMLKSGSKQTTARVGDLWGIIPAITGKVELVYEGETEGPQAVALSFIEKALNEVFLSYFPDPNDLKKDQKDPYGVLRAYFQSGKTVDLFGDLSDQEYQELLDSIPGVTTLLKGIKHHPSETYILKELILHGLASGEILTRSIVEGKVSFEDILANMWDDLDVSDN